MADPANQKSNITPRQGFVRSNSGQGQTVISPGGIRTVTITGNMSANPAVLAGISPQFSSTATRAIKESRDKDKKDLQDLNDRFATYIEKVRFLEAQNRKLTGDLENLRNRWGKETSSIKQMYENELKEARKLIDDTARGKAETEKEVARLKDDLKEARRKYDDSAKQHEKDKEKMDGYLTQLSDAEAEIGLLRRRIGNLEDEVNRLKKDNARLQGELAKARTDLDQETLNRIDYQNQLQTLNEEIDFLRRVHEQELKELQALVARDTTAENREFFKNELALAIKDIRNEYDTISNNNKNDMENWYKMKVQEVATSANKNNLESGYQKEETRRLRNQLGDLRNKLGDLESRNAMLEKRVAELSGQLEDEQREYEAAIVDRDGQISKMKQECEMLLTELQNLLDTKQTLDAEILIYRKMLEGEENRKGLRQLVEGNMRSTAAPAGDNTGAPSPAEGPPSVRTSFQRSAKGNVSIAETNPDGKFIIMENTSRNKDENMDEWKLKRKIDGKREIVFTLPPKFVLAPGKSVKIWARNQGGAHAPPDQLIFEGEDTWGQGSNIQTTLYNKEGDERATHVQRTTPATNL